MPRYLNHETDQFWEITLDGNGFRTRFGSTGTTGEESQKTWSDAARAQAEYDKLIARKQQGGFELDDGKRHRKRAKVPALAAATRGARNPELEAEIANDLDDRDAFRVYGDWLTEQGDPRGELIALQSRRGHEKAAAKLIAAERAHFLGDLHELSEQTLRVTWRHGFIETVHLAKIAGGEDDDDRSTGELLRAVLQHPSGAFVRELAFGTADGVEDGHVHYDSILTALATVRPPFVQSIYLGDFDEFEVSWTHAGDVSGLWKLPRLETLTIRAGSMELGTINAPALRELELISGGLTKPCIRSIAAARCPRLEKLRVWFGSSSYGASGGVADLAKLLRSKELPALTHLGLMNAEFTDELCAALGTSPLVRQLATLDLSKGTMTSAGVASLLKHERAFAHLQALDVSDNCLSRTDVAQLQGLCKRVATGRQKTAEERYVSLGE